jgi:hypothetical protein
VLGIQNAFFLPHEQVLGAVYMMEGAMILSFEISH